MRGISASERRRTRRVRMSQPIRVRPADPKSASFEEIGTTTNVSRDGIYFISEREEYVENMRLFVTMPYHTRVHPLNFEYVGQVARIDSLPQGKRGIAVRLLAAAKNNRNN